MVTGFGQPHYHTILFVDPAYKLCLKPEYAHFASSSTKGVNFKMHNPFGFLLKQSDINV
jgi:hypothetical protein